MAILHLVLLTAICAIVFFKLAQRLYDRYRLISIIEKIPGPKAYPLVGTALEELRVDRRDRLKWLRNIYREYEAGIYRTWNGLQATVNLITPETVSVIMPSKSLITKSEVYEFVRPWLGTGLLTSSGEKWHRHRKLITPTFHFDILDQFVVVMIKKAEILKECITSKLEHDPNNSVEVFELLTRCALDIICESTMGININAQTDHNAGISTALNSLVPQTMERLLRPWLHSDWIYYRTSRGKKFKHTVEVTHEFTDRVISERKLARKLREQGSDKDNVYTDKPQRKAFLDLLLDASDRDDNPFTDEEVREEVDNFMFAGHDTTAAAMSWALFCIGNHPEVEEKIHQEQLQVFGDSTEPATVEQLSELKYLDRVIKETLRLFPSAPWVGRRVTVEDIEIAGYKIPKSTVVGIHIGQVHRDPNHWPEPEKFDPDRFLPVNSHGRHPYAYMPFSAGPRNCIGQKFAQLEQKTVLTTLLRTWKVQSLVKYNDAKCYNELILRPQDGLEIYLTPKNQEFSSKEVKA